MTSVSPPRSASANHSALHATLDATLTGQRHYEFSPTNEGTATPSGSSLLPPLNATVAHAARPQIVGRIQRLWESQAEIVGLSVGPGDLVEVGSRDRVPAEVVAVNGPEAIILPYGDLRGRRVGEPVIFTGRPMEVAAGPQLLGRIIDGLGHPIDDGPELSSDFTVPVHNHAPVAMGRPLVSTPMPVGVRVIDTLLTCGRGQRVAILAGSGVGKSSLLSMIARGSEADVTVLCLVGERGRELREFIEHDLGPEGLKRSVVVVATSDQPAMIRRNAAYLATRVAESFRDSGMHVNLLMDSVTRFALAQREIGLAAGEIPTARGLPPSALGLLPGLLERAGTSEHGSITGFYTVLVEGDDLNDPVGDTVRSIVDGHISLSRDLANSGHFPSIDVLHSASRVSRAVTSEQQQQLAAVARRVLATYDRARDLIEVGAYVSGADPALDEALQIYPHLVDFTQQSIGDLTPLAQSWQTLHQVLTQPRHPGSSG